MLFALNLIMKNTIPQSSFWVYLSTILLPINGGLINGATLISFLHNSVGYVTGNLVLSGTSFSLQQYSLFARLLGLIACFLIGSIISGLMIRSEYYNKDHRYEMNLALQLSLVIIAFFLMHYGNSACEFLLAMAMGLQNAMTTHYGTALIRTTHMTGTTTDLGILIAHIIKGKNIQLWKLRLYVTLIISFFFGSIVGGFLFVKFQAYGLTASMLIYSVMIISYKL